MRRLILGIMALLLLLALGPRSSSAANTNAGYTDFSYGSAIGDDPTADKPQSKLWYNDGRWWAVMFHTASNTWHIYKLNWPSQWVDTGVVADDRPTSRADALSDGAKLYIASLVRANSSNQGRLYRYSYSAGAQSYSLDSGFPVAIMSGSAETLAFDKDSTGKFWITYTQGKKVYVNRSTSAGGAAWGTPFVVPGPTSATSLSSDDISSLVAYHDQSGNSIGVLWSNQNTPSSMYFAFHRDGDADTTWQPVQAIYTATCAADDHINLKSLQSDASGTIYAAVKTSFGDSGCGGSSSSPLIRLVVRRPNNTWAVSTFGTVGDDHTRPLVLLDTTNRMVYMFATSPTKCGVIYMKSTSMDSLSFPAGKGTPFISSSTYTCINNATSTKQTVSAASGLLVMASDESQHVYLHNILALGGAPPDTTPPAVVSSAPANNATNVSVSSSVSASFSEAVTGVSSSSFTLTSEGGAAVAASVSYAGQVATLQPSASLAPGTVYIASLSAAIKDAANNALAPFSWRFTTAAASSDTTPPTVTARSPASQASNVSLGSRVTVTFSEALNPATINGSTFTLSGPSGQVAASVSYDAAAQTATLQPSASLAASSTYTALLSGTITDLAGNPLATPDSWSFSTAAASQSGGTFTFGPSADTYVSQAAPSSTYGTSSSVSVVDGNGSAKQAFIRFSVSGLPAGAAISSAKLRLYVTNDSTSGGIVQGLSNTSWAEALTWTNKPAIDGPVLATLGPVAVGALVEVDVSAAISGNGVYSFAITLPTGNTNTLGYASRENSTTGSRPQLVIITS